MAMVRYERGEALSGGGAPGFAGLRIGTIKASATHVSTSSPRMAFESTVASTFAMLVR